MCVSHLRILLMFFVVTAFSISSTFPLNAFGAVAVLMYFYALSILLRCSFKFTNTKHLSNVPNLYNLYLQCETWYMAPYNMA